MLNQIAAWGMIVFSGLWAGAIVVFAVERSQIWRLMPVDQYAVDFRRSVLRVDPMLPIFGAISGIGAAYVGWIDQGLRASLAWAALALTLVVILGSIIIAEPMNSKFRQLPEGTIPNGAELIRDKWRMFHMARTLVAVVAFGCAAASVVN